MAWKARYRSGSSQHNLSGVYINCFESVAEIRQQPTLVANYAA